jgi:hypothetical protein
VSARAVSRADRVRDTVAVAVLAAGGAIWLYGFLGLRTIQRDPILVAPGGPTAVQQAVHYWNFTRAGAAVALLGVLGVVWSFWRHHRQQQTR